MGVLNEKRCNYAHYWMAVDDWFPRSELRRYGRVCGYPKCKKILLMRNHRFVMTWNGMNNMYTISMMMDTLRQFYHKYDEIIRFSTYAFAGWFLSWVLFFIMLPFMVQTYGKIRGASLNYGFSWFSMIAIILGLEFSLG